MIRICLLILLACVSISRDVLAQNAEFINHIVNMKQNERGPFKRLRWFCEDGSVLAPEPYACKSHGGGVQHGEYADKTLAVREAGYPIATLLADLTPADVQDPNGQFRLLNSMLLERFLISFDDGWIYRKARFYRGAIQIEDEQRSGQAILEAFAGNQRYLAEHFLQMREAVRLLPHDQILISLSDMRGLAASIADQDSGFRAMRGKIHGRPDAEDAERVRKYARESGKRELRSEYKRLASLIDETYSANTLQEVMGTLPNAVSASQVKQELSLLAENATTSPSQRFDAASSALQRIRQLIRLEEDAGARVSMLDASIEIERIAFIAGRELLNEGISLPRTTLLNRLLSAARGLYGAGLITAAEMSEANLAIRSIFANGLTQARYRSELQRLGLVSEWANRQLNFHFGATIAHLSDIEPLVDQYIPDRLRGSTLLIFQELHDQLSLDAQITSGVTHEVFGQSIASGVRSLNPGIVRGTLYFADHDTQLSDFNSDGIYVVPETLPRIPPVAGILTRSEGNALSHVQLLARNLGIPNVVVSEQVEDKLRQHEGKKIVVAASGGGVVRIALDAFQWDNVLRGQDAMERTPLQINIEKLNLKNQQLYSLEDLRSSDSGRVAGPKAAKLGELMHRFSGQVSAGIVIPFGVYRQLLEQPMSVGDTQSMHDWMTLNYKRLSDLRNSSPQTYAGELEKTLQFIRQWILSAPLPADLERRLRQQMQAEFGEEGSYGLFVRSDTNVEDLPNFSGAGLNLTVPNVVGFDATVSAIRRVWASPFSARAFAWRQELMDKPEHVYASVLLQVGVPADKSGVLVTQDLVSGSANVATVVVNQGVGGGVDGQLAETLIINLQTGEARRVSSATATERTVLLTSGGIGKERITDSEVVLKPADIEQLRQLSLVIPERIEEFRKREIGHTPAADVEFGFLDGKLWLFQLRPFVNSAAENRNRYLIALDAGLLASSQQSVELDQIVKRAIK